MAKTKLAKTIHEDIFIKDNGYKGAMKFFTYGLFNKAPGAWTRKEHKEAGIITPIASFIYEKYKFSQDEIDKKFKKSKDIDLTKVVDFISTITSAKPVDEKTGRLGNDLYQWIMRGANNHKGSLCSFVIMLEGQLRGFVANDNNEVSKSNATDLIKEQQKRFQKYKFGSIEPVDGKADMFVSYAIPMLLAYHGYKVDKGFVDYLVNELKAQNLPVPQELLDLQSGKVVKDLVKKQVKKVEMPQKSEEQPQVEPKQEQVQPKKSAIELVFEQLDIENKYKKFMEEKNATTLASLNASISAFVSKVADQRQIEQYVENDDLANIITFKYLIKNNELSEKRIEEIEKIYAGLTQEERATDRGMNILAVYSQIYQMKKEQAKKLQTALSANISATKKEQASLKDTEALIIKTAENNEEELKIKKAEIKEDKEVKPLIELPSQGIDYEALAQRLFLNQEYDLNDLLKVEMTVTTEIFDKKFERKEYPFADAVKNKSSDIKAIYMDMDEELKKGVILSLGLNEKAKIKTQEMVENYYNLSDQEKELVKQLAVTYTDVKDALIKKVQQNEEDKKAKKSSCQKRMHELMEKYNLDKPEF